MRLTNKKINRIHYRHKTSLQPEQHYTTSLRQLLINTKTDQSRIHNRIAKQQPINNPNQKSIVMNDQQKIREFTEYSDSPSNNPEFYTPSKNYGYPPSKNHHKSTVYQTVNLNRHSQEQQRQDISGQFTHNRQSLGLKRMKLPKLHRNGRTSEDHHREYRKSNLKTIDREIICNYMNAVLIEVKNKPKIKNKRPKIRHKYHDTTNFNSPEPIQSLRNPTSPLHYDAKPHRHSSRTQNLNSIHRLPKPAFHDKKKINLSKSPKEIISTNPQDKIKKDKNKSKKKYNKNNHIRLYDQQQKHRNDSPSTSEVKQTFPQGNEKQWEKIDPLFLETYFVKLKHKKITENLAKTQDKQLLELLTHIPSKDQLSQFIKQYIPQNKDIKIDQLVRKQGFQVIFEEDNEFGSAYLYFGETVDSNPCTREGLGVLICDKYVFEGYWKDDEKLSGLQKSKYGTYIGSFRNNKRDGEGQFFWNHGEYYTGEWKEGRKCGKGYWKSATDQNYMGQWLDGQVNGYGIHTMKNGRKYEGEFINFLKHGSGKQVFPNGDLYEGNYVMGYPHGQGKYKWKCGYVYQGSFFEGYREGNGKIWAENRMQFTGRFKQEKAEGQCKMKYGNGDIFEGFYEGSERKGPGVLKLKKEHTVIKGIWENNELRCETN